MDISIMDKQLRSITPSEQWHLDHPNLLSPAYDSIPSTEVGGQRVYVFDWRHTIKQNSVALIKETRFASIPAHVNTAMEINYIYCGSCRYIIDGQEIVLHTGDFVLLDTEAVRSAPDIKGKDDIVIALTFERAFFDSVFLARLPGGGVLTTFLFESIAHKRKRDHHLIVHAKHAGMAPDVTHLLMHEYLFPDVYGSALLSNYATLLFLEFIRALYYESQETGTAANIDDAAAAVLDYIERHYKECTLKSVAERFGYHPSYLTSMLKEKTGETFGQIKVGQQMSEAAYLLLNTDRSIESVARKVGISNMSYFYRKFRDFFGMTPKHYRTYVAAPDDRRISPESGRPTKTNSRVTPGP